ncbi:MAG: GFA family protein [Beijerinckiaceae bacterium]|nr:GFA family protein [Beijerinckiaceae bacterium]MCZ8301604.1 GFA family protein [Beijerinckiaceae bacterium]
MAETKDRIDAKARSVAGGCQCGAVRYACEAVIHPSICHCRMCQKAVGNAFTPMATAEALVWTRGAPKRFRSSNAAQRGFCADCGTPMTYEADGGAVEIMICTLDEPDRFAPALQLARNSRVAWVDQLASLPTRSEAEQAAREPFYASILSYKHPDHDTTDWKHRS